MNNNLRKIRIERKLRLVDLSRESGVSIGWIWNIENGLSRGSSEKTKQKIANALEVSLEEIFPEEN